MADEAADIKTSEGVEVLCFNEVLRRALPAEGGGLLDALRWASADGVCPEAQCILCRALSRKIVLDSTTRDRASPVFEYRCGVTSPPVCVGCLRGGRDGVIDLRVNLVLG